MTTHNQALNGNHMAYKENMDAFEKWFTGKFGRSVLPFWLPYNVPYSIDGQTQWKLWNARLRDNVSPYQ